MWVINGTTMLPLFFLGVRIDALAVGVDHDAAPTAGLPGRDSPGDIRALVHIDP